MPLPTPLIRVVIIDDQPVIRAYIKSIVASQQGFVIVGECGSVQDGRVLLGATSPDLVLLDINLGDGTSFDLLESIGFLPFKVIFLTAFSEFAIRAIKVGALDYLLKPVEEPELITALQKVTSTSLTDAVQIAVAGDQYREENKRLVLRTQAYIQVVDFDDIMYCKSDAGYTTFFLSDGRKVVTSKTIKEYHSLLPLAQFLRPHQSFAVNFRFIDRYRRGVDGGDIILKNGAEIPVATRRKEEVIEAITGNR